MWIDEPMDTAAALFLDWQRINKTHLRRRELTQVLFLKKALIVRKSGTPPADPPHLSRRRQSSPFTPE